MAVGIVGAIGGPWTWGGGPKRGTPNTHWLGEKGATKWVFVGWRTFKTHSRSLFASFFKHFLPQRSTFCLEGIHAWKHVCFVEGFDVLSTLDKPATKAFSVGLSLILRLKKQLDFPFFVSADDPKSDYVSLKRSI